MRWTQMTSTENTVFAYDPIPLRDNGTILMLTEVYENAMNGYQAIKTFKIEDLSERIPSDYGRFVCEYVL